MHLTEFELITEFKLIRVVHGSIVVHVKLYEHMLPCFVLCAAGTLGQSVRGKQSRC